MKQNELKAGVIGLGMIGGGIAISLAHSGNVPAVYDVQVELKKENKRLEEENLRLRMENDYLKN